MDKYIGMDVHRATTVMGVMAARGRHLMETIVETQASSIRQAMQGLSGTLHVTLEEGTHAQWLHDLLRPLVDELVVCDPRRNKLLKSGSKGDKMDAWKLAELLRTHSLKAVYHEDGSRQVLKELVRSYPSIVQDSTRVMNRLKAIFRSRAIPCTGTKIYPWANKKHWLKLLSNAGARWRAEHLYQQLECLQPLRKAAKGRRLVESRKHSAHSILRSIPGLGPVAVAGVLALWVTPHRFRTKRQVWAYAGFGLRTQASGEYKLVRGHLQRSPKAVLVRGLNPDYNRTLKYIFKTAATAASGRGPWKPWYESRLARGLPPPSARLTLARKLIAITFTWWKKGEPFDSRKLMKSTS